MRHRRRLVRTGTAQFAGLRSALNILAIGRVLLILYSRHRRGSSSGISRSSEGVSLGPRDEGRHHVTESQQTLVDRDALLEGVACGEM